MFKPGRKNSAQEQELQEQDRRSGKKRRNKRKTSTLPDRLQAAVDHQKREVMPKALTRRRRRAGYAVTAVRTVIRYMNARERTTIYRHS